MLQTIPSVTKEGRMGYEMDDRDKDSSFGTRVIAFAAVEGVFFSGIFL